MSDPIRADPQEAAAAAVVPFGANAEEISSWWASLGQAERDGLIAAHPPQLGNLSGIPADVRNRVNTGVMNEDLRRVEDAAERHGATVDAVIRSPTQHGLSNDDIVRYRNADQTRRGLEHNRGSDPGNPRPVMLWAYEPLAFNGQGRAAIALGNPDAAGNIAVVVPGAGSSVAGGWLSGGHNAAINLYDRSLAAQPDVDTSVIAWMGYDAPDGFDDQRIGAPWLARAGGLRLARDVNGLWVTHAGANPPHLTVIGHSYGATTVADAFAGTGMRANDAILLGSPGTDLARRAADFRVDGGEVYVGAASTDPVSWIGATGSVPNKLNELLGRPLGRYAGLGIDPAGDGFGSVRFKAEAPGAATLNLRDHSHYYDLGGEALRAMTHIVTGHGDALARDGLLAEGRRQPRLTTPREVTIPGIGRIILPHIDTRIPGTPAYIDPEAARPRE